MKAAEQGQRAAFWADAAVRWRSPGARRWYFGSLWGIVYIAIPVIIAWATGISPVPGALLTLQLVVLAVVYVVIPPLIWARPWWVALIVLVAFFAYCCLAFPLIGVNAIWLWMYVPIMCAFSWQSRRLTVGIIVAVVVAQCAVITAQNEWPDYWYAVALTASMSIMMLAFGQQIQAIARLREAQSEIARLAVVDERERFARDMHDVLGHSLTVVTVKSELARRLVASDPDRATAELADIEQLARAALADVRASVAGYRSMTLATELAAANAALTAAGIAPHLPTTTDVVLPELRETFAWVLREAVTNVVRHSGARNCWVAVEPRAVVVGDDGRGMPATAPSGHGLEGLRERVAEAGAVLRIEPADGGGTILSARVGAVPDEPIGRPHGSGHAAGGAGDGVGPRSLPDPRARKEER